MVTLTFDDGPSAAFTPMLLQMLAKENIRATFFVLGQLIETTTGSSIVQTARGSGHQIGNHSYDHPHLKQKTEAEIRQQLAKTQELIDKLKVGDPKKYFRPPYGEQNATIRKVSQGLGFKTVLWDADSNDWHNHTPTWIDKALSEIKPNGHSIVLNHDIHKATVENVPTFIAAIRKRFPNVRFVPLP